MDSDTTHATHMNMYHERARREREMEAEIQRLKAALEWYADSANYVVWLNDQDAAVMIDGGERARKAKGGVE